MKMMTGGKDQGSTRGSWQRSELQNSLMKKEVPRKYNKLSIPAALETAKTILSNHLKSYTRDIDARRIIKVKGRIQHLCSVDRRNL